MKILSLNFLTCAVKACKTSTASFPLHPKDAELVQDDIELNEKMLINVLPRLDWTALRTNATEVSTLASTLTACPALLPCDRSMLVFDRVFASSSCPSFFFLSFVV